MLATTLHGAASDWKLLMCVRIMHAVETRTRRIRQRLEREGWYLYRHGAGHDIYHHASIALVITLPRHRTVKPGVARSIAKAAGWED